jgi:hypothetical protein
VRRSARVKSDKYQKRTGDQMRAVARTTMGRLTHDPRPLNQQLEPVQAAAVSADAVKTSTVATVPIPKVTAKNTMPIIFIANPLRSTRCQWPRFESREVTPVTELRVSTARCRKPTTSCVTGLYYFNCDEIDENVVLSFVPMPFTAVMMTTAMPAAIRAYSMEVAPVSSLRNARSRINIGSSIGKDFH